MTSENFIVSFHGVAGGDAQFSPARNIRPELSKDVWVEGGWGRRGGGGEGGWWRKRVSFQIRTGTEGDVGGATRRSVCSSSTSTNTSSP